MKLISAVFILLFATSAWAQNVRVNPPAQIRSALFAQAIHALQNHPEARRDRIGIVDFAKPSSEPRFYLIDLKHGQVESYLTAHGKGSDPVERGTADRFSNQPETHASSLGAYLVADPYRGKHGLSLALDGLDPTNSGARARAIVLHAADYMTPRFISTHGRPGRSWGCFVVDPHVLAHVVSWLQGGTLIYAGK